MEDYLIPIFAIIGTLLTSVTILLLGNHLNIWRRTQDSGVSNTFNIGSMQEDVKKMEKTQDDFKSHLDTKLDGLMQLIEKKDEANRRELTRIWEQNNTLDKKMIRLEVRLEQLEKQK